MIYKNKKGQMLVSNDVMKKVLEIGKRSKEMTQLEPGEEISPIKGYKEYIDAYKQRIKSREEKEPFVPDWKKTSTNE